MNLTVALILLFVAGVSVLGLYLLRKEKQRS